MEIADKTRRKKAPWDAFSDTATISPGSVSKERYFHNNHSEYHTTINESEVTATMLREQLQLQHDNLRRLQADTKALSREKNTFDQMFVNSPMGCVLIDRLQQMVKVNAAARRLLGTKAREGALLPLLIEPQYRKSLAERIEVASRGSSGKLPVRLMTPGKAELDALITDVVLHIEPLHDHRNDKIVCHITIEIVEQYHAVEDELRKARDYLQQLASHDELTGLPNRRKLTEELSINLDKARENQTPLVVVLLDLNRFKQVNDNLGHNCGDNMLVETARRLKHSVKDLNNVTVARLGGDEFAIAICWDGLTRCLSPRAIAQHTCHRIAECLEQPYQLEDQQIQSSASIGVSVFPADASNHKKLLHFADAAMYRAKRNKKSERECSICFFDDTMKNQLLRREQLEKDLRATHSPGEISVWYQPIMSINPSTRDVRVVELEALVRWHHHAHGMVRPEEFLQIAQDCGAIRKLGFNVIEQSLITLANLHALGFHKLGMSINITAAQFTDHEFPAKLVGALYANGLRPKHLNIELTENTLLDGCHSSKQFLAAIADSGIRLSIDDFGTGYSSFSHLRQLKISRIKIARSFVQKLPMDSDDCSIVTAIASIARDLEIDIGAIGVENANQLDFLTTAGCTTVQGYLLSKPVPAVELPACIEHLDSLRTLPDLHAITKTPCTT